MKILEQKSWTLEVKCTGAGNNTAGCGSVLEIDKSDIRYYPGKSGDPATDGTFFYAPEAAVIRCPVCGALTDLDKDQRPADFKQCTPFTGAWKRGEDHEHFT
jgi:hypothetical protein